MLPCRDPGSNRGPLDLQSNALPTELSRQIYQYVKIHLPVDSYYLYVEMCSKRLQMDLLFLNSCNVLLKEMQEG